MGRREWPMSFEKVVTGMGGGLKSRRRLWFLSRVREDSDVIGRIDEKVEHSNWDTARVLVPALRRGYG